MQWDAFIGWMVYLIDLGIRVVALGTVPKNRRPSSGTAWLLLIFITPILGTLFFLMLGRTRIGRKRYERQRADNQRVLEAAPSLPETPMPANFPVYLHSVVELNNNLGSLPPLGGNKVDLYPGYQESIDAMAAEIDKATSFVHVEFYITSWDSATDVFYSALARAVARGVDVRLLFDDIGTRGIPGYPEFIRRLDEANIDYHALLPIRILKGQFQRPDLRNHRKILVVDGLVAFTGSQNLIERSYNKPKHQRAGRQWVELMARIEGPAVVALDVVFATDWHKETGHELSDELSIHPEIRGDVAGQVIPSGPGVVEENNLRAFTTLIYAAQRRVSLTSPYFVPDESLLYAVTTAAQRGLDVELFVGEEKEQFMVYHAQRSYYEALLRAGVRIWLYPSPWVLHSKHFTIDDDVAVIGSSNMDMRSFALNFEVSLLLAGGDIVSRLREVEDTYRSVSRELTLDEWLDRPRGGAYLDNFMRLTAALQ